MIVVGLKCENDAERKVSYDEGKVHNLIFLFYFSILFC